MKEVTPKKHTNMQVSGNSKSWAKDTNDYLFWRDRSVKELIGNVDSDWTMDQKLSYEESKKCCSNRNLDVDVDSALRIVIGVFLEGESKILTVMGRSQRPAKTWGSAQVWP